MVARYDLRLWGSAVCALLVVSMGSVLGQDKIAQTPPLIQEGFGPGGFDLVGDGSSFCGPTTTTMSLAYLASVGFTQILPSNPGFADYLQLEQNIVGLSGATQLSGATVDGLQTAVQTFLSAKGISDMSFTLQADPDVAWFTSQIPQTYSSSFLLLGWYSQNSDGTFTRNGGHFIGVTATNLSALGVSGSNYLVLSNPAPSTIFNVPDVPESNPQFAHMIDFSGTITGGGPTPVMQFDYNQTNSAVTERFPGLVEEGITISIDPSQLPSNPGWTPATWVLSSTTPAINTGGGDLTVLAPIAGDGGLHKGGGGTLYLTAGSNTSTGQNVLSAGGISSNQTSGTPLGTGDVLLQYGKLTLQPAFSGTPADISLALASGSDSRLHYTGGAVLALDPNGNNRLTVTIGDATKTAQENFTGTAGGTLVIAAATGNTSLGSTVKVLLAGSGTLPVHNGMITPAVVAEDSNSDGDFVTYDPTNGFTVASYTSSGSVAINSATNTTVYNVLTNQTLAADSTAELFALRVENSTISSGGGITTLRVGPLQTGDNGGVILNGGQINSSDLEFGDAEGTIYTSNGGGLISSTIRTTAGLTLFGPGNLTLTGSSAYTGGTRVQSGTLTVQNTVGSATGGEAVTVGPAATVVVSGPQARIGGTVTVKNGATLTLIDGSVGGVTLDALGYLGGHGTVTGPADINGTVGISGTTAGTLIFKGATTFEGNSVFQFTLTSLTSTETGGGVAGVNWNYVEFQTSDPIHLGTSSAPFSLGTDFSLVDDPNSGNSFWDEDHSWLLMKSATAFAEDPNVYFGIPNFTQGYFQWNNLDDNKELWLFYTAVPEPGTNMLLAAGLGLLLFSLRCKQVASDRAAH